MTGYDGSLRNECHHGIQGETRENPCFAHDRFPQEPVSICAKANPPSASRCFKPSSVQREQSESFFHRTDYTLGGTPLGELPLNSVVCAPRGGTTVCGYAVAGGGRVVDGVEVSFDGGATWHDAALDGRGDPWTWRLWHAELEPGAQEVLVRASDDAGGRQPEAMPAVSNPRGYANNAWHRVRLTSVGKREG